MLSADNDSRLAGTSVRRRNVVSPVRPLALLSVVIPIFVLLVYLFTAWRSVTPARSSALADLGPANKSSVFNVNWDGAYPEARTAYAFTFVEGRWDDDQRVMGIRVAMESLKHSGSKRQIVVLVGSSVRKSTRDVFRSHGATVIDMPSPSTATTAAAASAQGSDAAAAPAAVSLSAPAPYPTGAALPELINIDSDINAASSALGHCRQDYAPLHLFALHDRFDRVVWLDADHVVQLTMDELFLCGRFCMVYMNLNWYTAAVLVVKPDAAVHRALLAAAADSTSAPAKLAAAAGSEDQCQRAWEDFLIEQFWNLEAAPAFDPTQGQQDVPRMRLGSGYAVNPLFWIEKYDWSLARVKEYSHMSSNSVFDVPAHSLSWPRFKPWHWFPAFYFNVHWIWGYWKAILVPESSATLYCGTIIAVLLLVLLPMQPLAALLTFAHRRLAVPSPSTPGAHTNSAAPGALWYRAAAAVARTSARFGWNLIGLPLGYALTVALACLAHAVIPPMTLYYDAWPVYICLLAALTHATLRLFALLLTLPLAGPAAFARPEAPPAALAAALDARSSSAGSTLALAALMEPPGGLPAPALAWAVEALTSPTRLLLPTVLMLLTFIAFHGDYFAHFVLKIILVMSSVWYWLHYLAGGYVAVLKLAAFSLPAVHASWKRT